MKPSRFDKYQDKKSRTFLQIRMTVFYSIYYRENNKSCFFRRCRIFLNDRFLSFYLVLIILYFFFIVYLLYWKCKIQGSKKIILKKYIIIINEALKQE